MNTIDILTDSHFISEDQHAQLVSTFNETGIKLQSNRADTHAIGGPHFYPTDLIITIGGEIANGFWQAVGAGIAVKVAMVFRDVFRNRKASPNGYISYGLNELSVFFDMDTHNYRDNTVVTDPQKIKAALLEIDGALALLQEVVSPALLSLSGDPWSIVMKYDYELNRWLIKEFNSTASIYYENYGD